MSQSMVRPWNKGRSVGPRQALTPLQVHQLRTHLRRSGNPHDLTLFLTAIDTMLRAAGLLKLKVSDVAHPNGSIKAHFP